MALDSVADIETAVQTLWLALKEGKHLNGDAAAHGAELIYELQSVFRRLYMLDDESLAAVGLTVTDATDATLVAFFGAGGEGENLRDGRFFQVLGTGDTTDNGLQAAKGSAVAANDVFYKNIGADTVVYIGNAASDKLFTFTGEDAASW